MRERKKNHTLFKRNLRVKSQIHPFFYNSRAGLCRTKSTPLPEILGTRMRSLRPRSGGGGGGAGGWSCGPITDPWGTPDVTGIQDDQEPLTTACCLLESSDIVQFSVFPSYVIVLELGLQMTVRYTVKGFLKIEKGGVGLASALYRVYPVVVAEMSCNWVVVDRFCLNPCWSSTRMLLEATCFEIWLSNYVILAYCIIQVKEVGL